MSNIQVTWQLQVHAAPTCVVFHFNFSFANGTVIPVWLYDSDCLEMYMSTEQWQSRCGVMKQEAIAIVNMLLQGHDLKIEER